MAIPPTPNADDIAKVSALFKPLELLLSPQFFGVADIPEKGPLLFVGNHTIYGVLDVPFMMLGLYRERGVYLRVLGDHVHFELPLWRTFLTRYGVVDGTRENCAELMRAGENILVFPGGAREVAKRKGEQYQLIWGQRLGFVKMAIQHQATIVPFAAVGADDAYDIVLDANDLWSSPLGRVFEKLGMRQGAVLPVALGIGPTPIPRPERLYFKFMPPVSTTEYEGQHDDDSVCWTVREQVAAQIEEGIVELQKYRSADPQNALLPRLSSALKAVTGQT